MTLEVSAAEYRGLACGEIVVACTPLGAVRPGARIALTPGRSSPPLKAAYSRWASRVDPLGLTATVVDVRAAEDFDPDRFAARHLFAEHPSGEVAVLAVSTDRGAVLGAEAFDARRASVEQALA